MLAEYWESLPLFKPAVSGKAGARVQRILADAHGAEYPSVSGQQPGARHGHRHCRGAAPHKNRHVSASVKTLQARGYLQRVFLAGNHKTVHLRLTPAAGPVVEQGRRAQQSFLPRCKKGLAPAERAVLKAAFHKMLKNARTALQGGRGTV